MSVTTIQLDAIPTGSYNVDPAHSNVGFEVRHMGIATVRGAFKKFAGTIRVGVTLEYGGYDRANLGEAQSNLA